MVDKITNWYATLDKEFKNETKKDKNFKNHLIEPNSLCLQIGPTGSGKTLTLLEFLSRKQNSFYEVIIFTTNSNEPLYKKLNENGQINFIQDVKELPKLNTFDDKNEKLIVFDDFVALPKKDVKIIETYIIALRKYKFTCFVMTQSYKDTSKLIARNMNYIFIYKQNDITPVINIYKNYCQEVNKDLFIQQYNICTRNKGDFMLIDLKTTNPKMKYRHNFITLLRM